MKSRRIKVGEGQRPHPHNTQLNSSGLNGAELKFASHKPTSPERNTADPELEEGG